MVSAPTGWPSSPSGVSPGLPDRRTGWLLTLRASRSPSKRPSACHQDSAKTTSPGRASGLADSPASCPSGTPGKLGGSDTPVGAQRHAAPAVVVDLHAEHLVQLDAAPLE